LEDGAAHAKALISSSHVRNLAVQHIEHSRHESVGILDRSPQGKVNLSGIPRILETTVCTLTNYHQAVSLPHDAPPGGHKP
jgi:hypothetical protein